jgi:hypothetical protein
MEVLVESPGHDHVHADHVVDGLEAAGREVPLQREKMNPVSSWFACVGALAH